MFVQQAGSGNSDRTSFPGVITPIPDSYNPSDSSITTEQDLAAEREDIVKAFLILLGQINGINTEPLGIRFTSKFNRIARVSHRA